MRKQPLEVQTLYAELLEQLAAFEAHRAIGHVAGSFVTKTIRGGEYYYFQFLEPGGAKRQVYLGRRDAALDAVVSRHAGARAEIAGDVESIQRLCSLLRAGGAMTTDAASARVLRALSDVGVFRLGGVLVGTHAFVAIGNLLGVSWAASGMRTQDVDVAAARTMEVAVPGISADIPTALESLEMGFLPVPGLDPSSPTTSFKVRGQALRLDLLAPARRVGQATVRLPRFSAAAQPMKFLDLVTEDAVRAGVIDGGGVSVNVPDPARFAFHELIVAVERSVATHAKRQKDLWQAAQVFEVLLDERLGDLSLAWNVVRERGWVSRVTRGIAEMEKAAPNVGARLRQMLAD